MSEQSETFATKAQALFDEQFADFASWMAEKWKAPDPEDGFNEHMAEGWNRCCASIESAYKVWLDEVGS